MQAFNLIRQVVLRSLDLSMDRQCIIDSLPTPVVQFHLVPGSAGDLRAFIFSYRLHLLITMCGLILNVGLTLTNTTNLEAGFEMLSQHTDLEGIGDKAYISAAKAAELWEHNCIRLRTFWSLCTRLINKLTAHTVCIYTNRLLGKPDFLQIKALAFPN
jgi:hypothetical protein